MNIGERIKSRRKELHMSADLLAERLGKDRSTVYRYENGDIENLPIDIVRPIAEALETTPDYIMGWNKETNSEGEEIALNEYMKSMALKFGQLNEQNQKTIETMVNALLLQQLSEENN